MFKAQMTKPSDFRDFVIPKTFSLRHSSFPYRWQPSAFHAKIVLAFRSRRPPMQKPMSRKFAVVLAAGKGTRMKSELPKVLIEICGRPMIDYVLDSLAHRLLHRR